MRVIRMDGLCGRVAETYGQMCTLLVCPAATAAEERISLSGPECVGASVLFQHNALDSVRAFCFGVCSCYLCVKHVIFGLFTCVLFASVRFCGLGNIKSKINGVNRARILKRTPLPRQERRVSTSPGRPMPLQQTVLRHSEKK